MKVLIAEDEPLASERLEEIILKYDPDIEVVGRMDTVESAIKFIKNEDYDIAFCDIKLADGISLSIFDKVPTLKPVVFTTAYDDYTLKAFKTNCIDYLLKPIKYKDVERALDKYYDLTNLSDSPSATLDNRLLQQLKVTLSQDYKKRFLVKAGNKFLFIKTEDISLFEADGKFVSLVTKDKALRFIIDYKMEELVDILDPKTFFRINRSYIVSVDSISEAKSYYNNRLKLQLNPSVDKELIVSRDKVSKFKAWLNE